MNININKVKIAVTVPIDSVEKVRKAMFDAGAGKIGTNYKNCSTVTKSIGTFKPINDAKPYIGEKNKLEVVEEEKLEVICILSQIKGVISNIRKAHPYEEPEIDIIPLLDEESFK